MRPDAEGQPARGDAERLGQRLKHLDASLTAVFNLGESAGADLGKPSESRFCKSPLDSHRLQAGTHAVTGWRWAIERHIAETVGQPAGGHSKPIRQAGDRGHGRQSLSCFGIERCRG